MATSVASEVTEMSVSDYVTNTPVLTPGQLDEMCGYYCRSRSSYPQEFVDFLLKNEIPETISDDILNYSDDLTTLLSSLCRFSHYTVADKRQIPRFREKFEFLIKRGVDVNARSKIVDKSPLMCCAGSTHSHPETISMLLHAGADVNQQNDNGHTALMYAVLYADYAIIQILLHHRADPDIKNHIGESARDYGAIRGISFEKLPDGKYICSKSNVHFD